MDKHWISPIFIIGFAVLTLFLCETCLGESIETHQDAVKIADKFKLPVQTHQDAIEIANKFTGFKELPNFSDVVITVQQVVIEEDDTVLYEWTEGRSFWKVSYENVALPLTIYRHNTPFINAFYVFVDVETGLVPKMLSQWMDGIDPRYKEAKHIFDEERKRFWISRRKEEKQYTVLKELPKNSFLELFKEVAPIDSRVKHIEVIYMYDLDNRGEKDVLVPVLCLKIYGGRERHCGGPPPAEPHRSPSNPSDFMNYDAIWFENVENLVGRPLVKAVSAEIRLDQSKNSDKISRRR